MKTSLLAVLSILLVTVANAAPTPDEYMHRDRRVSIHPGHPLKGIRKGLVIAYGHRVSPPYVVELRGEKILVNDLQVIPSIVDEKAIAARPLPAQDDKTKSFNDSLDQTSVQAQAMARNGVDREKVLEFVRKQPYVRAVSWRESGVLWITDEKNQSFFVVLPQPGEALPSEKEKRSRVISAMANRVQTIQSDLRRGQCVIFVDGGLSERPLAEGFSSTVRKIMEDPASSREEKIRRLREIVVEPAALDLLSNYSRDEWIEKKH